MHLRLKNYRCFEAQTFELDPRFSLLIGDNGDGKSAILEALAVALRAFFLGIPGVASQGIPREATRRITYDFEGLISLQPQLPVEVEAKGLIQGNPVTWMRTIQNVNTTSAESRALMKIAKGLADEVQAGAARSLPVFVWYATGRLWRLMHRRSSPKHGPQKLGSRLDGYRDCLDPQSNLLDFEQWLQRMALITAQEGHPLPHVSAVEKAVLSCIEGATRLWYDLRHEELRLALGDRIIPFSELSDGYRNLITIVCDIAWRAVTLNPHLGARAVQDASGVILIDEIDLHLHPRWQRRVVEDLKHAFPNLQFIATSHSPLIIQSLRPGELINLREDEPKPYADQSPEDIFEDVMGLPLVQRSRRRQAMADAAEAYYRVLQEIPGADKQHLAALKEELDALLEPYADDVAFATFLRMERLAAEGRR